MLWLGQRWPLVHVVRARWPNIVNKALVQRNFANRPYMYVGLASVATLGQRWQSALSQNNVARRPLVCPTLENQRQPPANQPTIK